MEGGLYEERFVWREVCMEGGLYEGRFVWREAWSDKIRLYLLHFPCSK